jgi:hypothetical protein
MAEMDGLNPVRPLRRTGISICSAVGTGKQAGQEESKNRKETVKKRTWETARRFDMFTYYAFPGSVGDENSPHAVSLVSGPNIALFFHLHHYPDCGAAVSLYDLAWRSRLERNAARQ